MCGYCYGGDGSKTVYEKGYVVIDGTKTVYEYGYATPTKPAPDNKKEKRDAG